VRQGKIGNRESEIDSQSDMERSHGTRRHVCVSRKDYFVTVIRILELLKFTISAKNYTVNRHPLTMLRLIGKPCPNNSECSNFGSPISFSEI